MTRLILADASRVTPADFFHAIFGDRAAREVKATAVRLARAEHQYAVQAAYRRGESPSKIAELQAALKARIAEIEAGASEERKAA